MKHDVVAIQKAQRSCFDFLKKGFKGPKDEEFTVDPDKISLPAQMVQELSFVNTKESWKFEFGSKSPVGTATLGNITIGDNDIFAFYGIRILLGEGANQVSRVYRSRGPLSGDNSLYNMTATMKFESNEDVQNIDMNNFYEEGDMHQYAGFTLINPIRVVSGRLGKMTFTISAQNSISALTLSSNMYISVRLIGAIGTA